MLRRAGLTVKTGVRLRPMKPHILLIEDDPLLAESLAANLEASGFLVPSTYANGLEALAASERQPPDLALVDIALEGTLRGTTVGAYLAERGIPVIYLSGYMELALAEGRDHAVEILPKTARFSDILAAVRAATQGLLMEASASEREIASTLDG